VSNGDRKLSELLDDLVRAGGRSQASFRELVQVAGLDPKTDFRGASLRGLDFRDEDLSGFDFSNADLSGSDFRRARLRGAVLDGADLTGTLGVNEAMSSAEPPGPNPKQAKQIIIGGGYPPENWAPSIKRLRLGNSGIRKIDGLAGLLWLQELSLMNTPIHDLSPISGLISLEELRLDNSRVTDLKPLSGLRSLSHLSIYNCKVRDLSPLRSVRSLSSLEATSSLISDESGLHNLPQLAWLRIGATKITTLNPIQNMNNLRYLDAQRLKLKDIAPLERHPCLNTLFLGEIQPISVFPTIPNLTSLTLHSGVANELPELTGLSKIRDLNFTFPSVRSIAPVADATTISHLRVGSLRPYDLTPLKNLLALTSLHLGLIRRGEHEGSLELGAISELSKLRTLDLTNWPVRDISPLRNMRSLRYLNLEGTQVKDISPILELPELRTLDVERTKVAPNALLPFKGRDVSICMPDGTWQNGTDL
jgi:Leucine-rich repeat (LRR) protein